MSVLLITYDHSKVDPKDDPVPKLVKNYNHVQLCDSSYAIETDEKTLTIFHKIMPYLSRNVHLFVVTLMQPYSGQGLDQNNNWLWKHLPEY
jgi:hypothetical protein